jgi:hypothetical protein
MIESQAMLRRRMLLGAIVVGAGLVAVAACDEGPVPQPCSDIPAGGCPLSRGLACEDPACEAVYLCRPNNVWELHERCPLREAGAPPDVNVDSGGPAPVLDASIDAPPGAFGGPNCGSLQAPDCALGIALACSQSCCGCEDLFVCEDDGWTLWGSCGDGGPTPEP